MRREPKQYCFECRGFDGRHQPGCPRDPEDEAPALDGDYEPDLPEDDDRDYDYQADLDKRWEAIERRANHGRHIR